LCWVDGGRCGKFVYLLSILNNLSLPVNILKHIIKYAVIYSVVFVFIDNIKLFYCSNTILISSIVSLVVYLLIVVKNLTLSFPSNWYNTVVGVVFISFLFLPLAQYTFNIVPETELTSQFNEKRELEGNPEFDKLEITDFPIKITAYFNDHFKLRKWFIAWNNYVKVKYLKVSPISNVSLGKGDWMFFTVPGVQESHEGIKKYTEEELKAITSNLIQRNNYLKEKGIKYYIAIAPDKYSIYPEKLPMNLKYSRVTQTDQLIQYLSENSEVNIIDLRANIADSKEIGQLFYKTDSHWNHNGAFIGAKTVLKRIKKDFPAIPTFKRGDYDVSEEVKKEQLEKLENISIQKSTNS